MADSNTNTKSTSEEINPAATLTNDNRTKTANAKNIVYKKCIFVLRGNAHVHKWNGQIYSPHGVPKSAVRLRKEECDLEDVVPLLASIKTELKDLDGEFEGMDGCFGPSGASMDPQMEGQSSGMDLENDEPDSGCDNDGESESEWGNEYEDENESDRESEYDENSDSDSGWGNENDYSDEDGNEIGSEIESESERDTPTIDDDDFDIRSMVDSQSEDVYETLNNDPIPSPELEETKPALNRNPFPSSTPPVLQTQVHECTSCPEADNVKDLLRAQSSTDNKLEMLTDKCEMLTEQIEHLNWQNKHLKAAQALASKQCYSLSWKLAEVSLQAQYLRMFARPLRPGVPLPFPQSARDYLEEHGLEPMIEG